VKSKQGGKGRKRKGEMQDGGNEPEDFGSDGEAWVTEGVNCEVFFDI